MNTKEFVVANNGAPIQERVFQERLKTRLPSRGVEIDRAQVLENVGGNQFYMIHIGARMTREILQQRRREEIDPFVTPIDALKVMQGKKVDINDYILTPPSDEWVQKWCASRANSACWNL